MRNAPSVQCLLAVSLSGVLLAGSALGLISPSIAASPAPLSEDAKILHVLNRLSYGPRPGDIDRVKAMGIDRYIQTQLNPQSIPENPQLMAQLNALPSLRTPPLQTFMKYGPLEKMNGQKPTQEQKQERRKEQQAILEEAIKARLLRDLQSERQLQEVMTEFWFNHFNIYARKVPLDTIWLGNYEETAIRPHALGKFRDLLEATSHHPAMLFYLDNWQNTAPDAHITTGKGKFNGLNENYARELMELHTMGVDGGYTQQDVIALARILTGWGFPRPQAVNQDMVQSGQVKFRGGGQGVQAMRRNWQDVLNGSGFYFDAKRHDSSVKTFLGHTIQPNGVNEGEQALDILSRHPATAHYVSYKLAQYFVSDNPPPELVSRLSARFLETDGDIKAMLDTLFHSPEFWSSASVQAKFKTPYRYVVSSVRAGNVPVSNVRPMAGAMMQMGMPLYGCETPNGYKYTQDAWLNPDGMTRRLSFATALASGLIPLAGGGRIQPGQAIEPMELARTIGNDFSETTLNALNTSPRQLQSALILGSPEFMKY